MTDLIDVRARVITQERLKELLDYDPETGWFRWKVSRRGSVRAGKIAGCIARHGYWFIGIDGRSYLASRLAWLWMTGEFPERLIDHIDGDGTHNAWRNLRAATPSQNIANSRCRNAIGLKGVYHDSRGDSQRYYSKITVDWRSIHLGSFNTPEEAHNAYMEAARKYFGEFANDGTSK